MAHSVQLALYDLSMGMAKTMSMAILGKQLEGIWHTGILVYGKEYFFGGGLQCMDHEQFVAMHGGVRPTEYIMLGHTDLPQEVFEDFNRQINPRFTAQTYNLMSHNCNNYTDEAAKFLLGGTGIPEYIINLPSEVLSSPMGPALRPLLERMTTQMNGADPFASTHQQSNETLLQPTSDQSSVRQVVGVSSGTQATFPILDKHTKPLVGSDTAKAASNVAARLKALGCSVEGLLREGEASILDALPQSLAAPKTSPVHPGSFAIMERIMKTASGWPDKAEFLALVLMSLMVLHEPDGAGMEKAMSAMAMRAQNKGILSAQSLSIALCAAANAFGTSAGTQYMLRPGVLSGWLDAALQGLEHERGEVRQMSSALLNNISLAVSKSMPDVKDGEDVSDEATQIVFGALDGIQDEKTETVALRRLLAAGRLVRRLGVAGASLVNEVGFREQVVHYKNTSADGEAKAAASELVCLLDSAYHL